MSLFCRKTQKTEGEMFLKEMKKSGYTILHLIFEFSNKEPKDCTKKQSLQLLMDDSNRF
jgi:hypothetical protein